MPKPTKKKPEEKGNQSYYDSLAMQNIYNSNPTFKPAGTLDTSDTIDKGEFDKMIEAGVAGNLVDDSIADKVVSGMGLPAAADISDLIKTPDNLGRNTPDIFSDFDAGEVENKDTSPVSGTGDVEDGGADDTKTGSDTGSYTDDSEDGKVGSIAEDVSKILDGDKSNPVYQSAYRDAIDGLVQKLTEQNYNEWAKGASYEDLLSRYAAAGRLAMQDTMGQVAARTGGLASTWAGSVAQQTYNDYMNQAEGAARDQYASERQQDIDMLDIYNALDKQDYSRWQDDQERADANRNRAIEYVTKYGMDAAQLAAQGLGGVLSDEDIETLQEYYNSTAKNNGTTTKDSASDNYKTVLDNALKYGNFSNSQFYDYDAARAAYEYVNSEYNGGNGSITLEEAQSILATLGINIDEIEE